MTIIKKLLNDENAATAIEYALIIALIAVAMVVAVSLAGYNLSAKFEKINNAMNTALTGAR